MSHTNNALDLGEILPSLNKEAMISCAFLYLNINLNSERKIKFGTDETISAVVKRLATLDGFHLKTDVNSKSF